MNSREPDRLFRFAEEFCRLPSGVGAGERIRLRPWQRKLFGGLAESGARRAYVQMPRKNGKSQLAAILGLYGLVADGEPSALVVSAAADREQARLVFGTARRMVETDEFLSKKIRVYRNELVVPETDSRYRVLSADAHTKEGLNVSLGLVDEIHAHPNRELYDVLSLSTGARAHPLILAITTPGARYDRFGADTVAYQLWDYGRRVAAGELDDPDFFFAEFAARADCDPTDRAAWREANPALGDFLHEGDLEAAVRVTPENEFKTKRLGIWTVAQQAWLPHGAWDGCAEPGPAPATGAKIVLGFDGSRSRDSTVLVGATVEAKPRLFLIKAWERPQQAAAQWQVPRAEVLAEVLAACAVWQVSELAADTALWVSELQELEGQRVPVVAFPQSPARMIPATQRFYEAAVAGTMRHDGAPLLARHVGNAYVKTTGQVSKEHKDSGRKIDAAVASIMAYDRAAVLGASRDRPPMVW